MDLRLLDEIGTAATASPIEERVAGWWCKAAPDLPFRRCNVVLPPLGAGEDAVAFDAAFDEVRAWYHRLGQRLIVQVSSADPRHDQLDGRLADHGLVVEAPVDILVSSVVPIDEAAATIAGLTVLVATGIDEAWARAYGQIHGGTDAQQARTTAYGRMLETFGDRALGASAVVDGTIAGVGFGVIDRGWLGIFGMGTAESFRRRGIATSVVRSLLVAAAGRGAQRAYLQVETDNAGAISLYRGLGFERSHGYHYRSEGTDPAQGC